MTVPLSVGSVASNTETKQPQLHYNRNLTSRTLHRSFPVGDSDGITMYHGPRPVWNLSKTFRFLALKIKKKAPDDMARMCEDECLWVWPSWRWRTWQRCMECRCWTKPDVANPIEWERDNTLSKMDMDGWLDHVEFRTELLVFHLMKTVILYKDLWCSSLHPISNNSSSLPHRITQVKLQQLIWEVVSYV